MFLHCFDEKKKKKIPSNNLLQFIEFIFHGYEEFANDSLHYDFMTVGSIKTRNIS